MESDKQGLGEFMQFLFLRIYAIPLLWSLLAWLGRTSWKQLPEPQQPGSGGWQEKGGQVMGGRSTCPTPGRALPGSQQSVAKESPVPGSFSVAELWLPPVLGDEALSSSLLSHTPSWPLALCWFHLFHGSHFSSNPLAEDWQYLYRAWYSRPLFKYCHKHD